MMRAYILGVREGWASPRGISGGMTYDSSRRSEAYDHGVNLGQRLRRTVIVWRTQP